MPGEAYTREMKRTGMRGAGHGATGKELPSRWRVLFGKFEVVVWNGKTMQRV